MGKKKGGANKGGAAAASNKPKAAKKSPFAVASAKNKKKPKEVKTNLKKVNFDLKTNLGNCLSLFLFQNRLKET